MEKKQINVQDKIRVYSSMITEAIQAANKAVKDMNASESNAGSIEALNNAAHAYEQVTGSVYINTEIALWIDTLAYNLPSGIVDYIKGMYDNKDVYKTGNM